MANKSRLQFVDPSKVASGNDLSGRGFVSPEELSILVELTSTLRSRSFIENDTNTNEATVTNNNNETSKPIGFLEGTNVSGRRSLTTNYTEVNTNLSVDGDNSLEALGIESINIKFDTAYTPNIQIKFIDVRGHAVLGQGNDSRYRMFFDLPYPIFNLTVKGFYGKPVTYCLHLTKWNASFNSSTGNFEIDTNFIGYTYALLTDCIIGLMRAVPYTTDGKQVIANRPDADTFTTIDELIDKIDKVDDEIEGIRTNSENVKQLNALKDVSDTLDSLNSRIAGIRASIKIPDDKYTKSGEILVLPSGTTETDLTKLTSPDVNKGFRNTLASYLNYIKNNIEGENGLNKKIKKQELKLDIDSLKDIKKITNILSKNITSESDFLTNATVEKNLTASNTDGNSSVSGSIENADTVYPEGDTRTKLFDQASSYKPSNDNTTIELLDLISPIDEILQKREKIEKINKELKRAIAEEFINKSLNASLNPTISNLIGILANNAEVFLKTIELVSKKASASEKRKEKLLGAIENLNVKGKSTATDVYPWPEYKKKDAKGIFEETWLGDLFNNNEDELKNIPELIFIEELLAGLLKIGREDLEREAFENGVKTPSFYPVSPADSSVILDAGNEFYVKNNPYYNAALIESGNVAGNPEEITRCLLMRGFLAFGVSNRIPFDDSDPYPEFLGAMEAANAINAITTESKDRGKARDLIRQIANEGGGIANDAKNAIIDLWKTGTDNVKNPNGKIQALLEEVGPTGDTVYRYSYISDQVGFGQRKYYLPITDNFDGQVFYKNGKIKSASELKSLSETVLFTGNYHGDIINASTVNGQIKDVSPDSSQGQVLLTTFSPQPGKKPTYEDDGSVYVKIITDVEKRYLKRINAPQFGEEKFETYNNTGWIKQSSLKELTYSDKGIPTLNRYNSPTNKALEFSYIIYDGDADSNENTYNTNIKGPDDTEYLGDISSIYWADNRQDFTLVNGTYLCSSLKEEFFKYQNTYENKLYIDFNDPESRTVVEKNSSGRYRTSSDYFNQWGKQKEIIPSNKGYLPYIEFGLINKANTECISLFGSTFYYGQETTKVEGKELHLGRAFLFLNSFTWQGIMGDINDKFTLSIYGTPQTEDVSLFDIFDYEGKSFKDEDETYSVKGIFSNYGAHIKAPKMWCAYIGSLLYRLDTWLADGEDIIKFSGGTTMFFPKQDKDSYTPTPFQYIRYLEGESISPASMVLFFDKYDVIRDDDDSDTYKEYPAIDRGIIGLPQQVRTEFKNIFLEFVEKEFEEIRSSLELFDDLKDKKSKWIELFNAGVNNKKATTPKKVTKQNGQSVEVKVDRYVKTSDIKSIFSGNTNISNYYNISPITSTSPKGGSFSGVKDQPWWKSDTSNNVVFPEFNLLLADNTNVMRTIIGYMKTPVYITNIKPDVFRSSFTSLERDGRNYIEASKKDMDRYLVAFFNEFIKLSEDWNKNKDNDDLKKRLFNTIDNDDIKLNLYRTIASIYNKWIAGGTDKCIRLDKLAETFNYLDKDFRDIGDKFYINPRLFSRRITSNYNQNFFDVANRTLSDNNFNFVPLPSFIDFDNDEALKDVFRPFPYKEAIKQGSVNPSFVCVYVGQTSTNLAIDGSETPDDGVFIRLDDDGNAINIPEGFVEEDGSNIPYFLVNYGQQNQSIFKDIKLDQREFTETAESLQIIEDLSRDGGDNSKKGVFNSQNLFNVYQKRSYSAQVEMMGNAMIQPMMYFQLNNIPMFRGAYLIISVNHSLSPNNMTTSFKGVRIKSTKTKLVDKEDFYISLIGDTSKAGEATSITGNVVRPGEVAISDASVNSDTITNSNGFYIEEGGGVYIVDRNNGLAGQTLREFMNDLSTYLSTTLPSKGIKLSFNGITRELKETSLGGPGRDKKSKHGAGLAIDVKFEGTYNNTQITNYTWPSSNTIVANDAEVMTQIKKYLTTNTKWKDTIKWGGDFKSGSKTSVVSTDSSIANFKVRTNEIHHFEIVDSKIKDYFQPYNSNLNDLELSIPNRQKDLVAIYLKPFEFKEDEKIALETIKEDKTEGDAVTFNNTTNNTA